MTFEELFLYNDNWTRDTVLTLVNYYSGNIITCGEGSYLAIFTKYFNSKVCGFKDNTVYLDIKEERINSMKISKDEAVYAVLKLVLNENITLDMLYNETWLYYLLTGLGLSTQEVISAKCEIKEAILNCLKENLKI